MSASGRIGAAVDEATDPSAVSLAFVAAPLSAMSAHYGAAVAAAMRAGNMIAPGYGGGGGGAPQ